MNSELPARGAACRPRATGPRRQGAEHLAQLPRLPICLLSARAQGTKCNKWFDRSPWGHLGIFNAFVPDWLGERLSSVHDRWLSAGDMHPGWQTEHSNATRVSGDRSRIVAGGAIDDDGDRVGHRGRCRPARLLLVSSRVIDPYRRGPTQLAIDLLHTHVIVMRASTGLRVDPAAAVFRLAGLKRRNYLTVLEHLHFG
jgi:hypothetical protein